MRQIKCSMCDEEIMCDDIMFVLHGTSDFICKECIKHIEDKVEVVRCKDCIYYKFGDMTIDNMYCCWAKEMYKNIYKIPMIAMEPNDYCSHGVRKKG